MRCEQPPTAEALAAVERVLDATGRSSLPAGLDISDLSKLLDPAGIRRLMVAKILPQQRSKRFAKDRARRFQKAGKLAGELHKLLSETEPPIWNGLSALDQGAGFPTSEADGDPWGNLSPLPSFSGTVNGLARLQERLETYVNEIGDAVHVHSSGLSGIEWTITSPILESFNILTGRPKGTPARRSRRNRKDGGQDTGGPFVRYAIAVLSELGLGTYSANTIAAAIIADNRRRRAGNGRKLSAP